MAIQLKKEIQTTFGRAINEVIPEQKDFQTSLRKTRFLEPLDDDLPLEKTG